MKNRADLIMRFILLATVSSVFALTSLGQKTPKAVLIDEHGRLPCDDLLGRLDLYFQELRRYPGSMGLVVISSTNNNKHLAVFRQRMIEEHVKAREFTSNEIKYVRAISDNDLRVQLWSVPSGSTEPTVKNVDMPYTLQPGIKPFMLGAEYYSGDHICPEVNDLPVFAAFLKSNSGSRGNIVVRARSVAQARRKADRIRREFREHYDISVSRLRFFPRKAAFAASDFEPLVEYWYLP